MRYGMLAESSGEASTTGLFTAKDAKENPKRQLLGFSFASFASFAVNNGRGETIPKYRQQPPITSSSDLDHRHRCRN